MFYIIYGDDNYRCHQALNEVKTGLDNPDLLTINTTILDGRKLNTKGLGEVCDSVPFMSPNRLVIVEGLLKRFQAGEKQLRSESNNSEDSNRPLREWQNIANYIKDMPKTTVLVLFEVDLDSKAYNPLLKTLSPVADSIFHLNELKGRELFNWIKDYAVKNGGKISVAAINLLMDYIGGDLWSLTSEINKLMTFCIDREISDRDIREITNFAREENIFALVDSVLEGKIKEAQLMLHRMLKYGIAPQQILAMIERQLAIILRIKDLSHAMPQQEIRERLGLHPRYPIDKTLKHAKTFTVSRLRKAFHCLLDADIAIKTGKYEDDLALDLLVIELCKY